MSELEKNMREKGRIRFQNKMQKAIKNRYEDNPAWSKCLG